MESENTLNTQECMNDYPLVTIGITTYNNVRTQFDCEKVLRRGLDCFVNQDYPNLEILIQDDCSSDNTFEVCKEYALKYPCVKISRNEKNLGIERNILHLTEKVKGEFFLWGCVDDLFDKSYITKCHQKLMLEPNKSFCQSYIKTVYSNKEVIDIYENIDIPHTTEKVEELNQLIFKRQDYKGKCSAVNPLIHGLVRAKWVKLVFGSSSLLFYEVSLPILLIWTGGLCVVEEVLFSNNAKTPFSERYPEASYVKKASSNFSIFICGLKILPYFIKTYLQKDIKVSLGVVVKTWGHLFYFFCLKKIGTELKTNSFNFLNKFFPPIISLYRFFKRLFQN